MRISLVLYLLPVLLSASLLQRLYAQPVLTPDDLTGRRLGHLADASAIGWNPALLGIHPEAYEVLLATSYADGYSVMGNSYALFGRLGPLGTGRIGPAGDRSETEGHSYLGFGWPILEDFLWLGGTYALADNGRFLDDAEITVGAVVQPFRDLWVDFAARNVTAAAGRDPCFGGGAAWSLWPGGTLHAAFTYDPADTLAGRSPFSSFTGLSIALLRNQLQLIGGVDPARSGLRFGAEWTTNGFNVGLLNNVARSNEIFGYTGSVITVRYSSELRGIPPPTTGRTWNRDGWAPERAYVPEGLNRPEGMTDAPRMPGSLTMPCAEIDGGMEASAGWLLLKLAGADTGYTSLIDMFRGMGPNEGDPFDMVRDRYYSSRARSRELWKERDHPAVATRKGYPLEIQNVEETGGEDVVLTLRVVDSLGESIGGLGREDFVMADPALKIIDVQPISAERPLPLDVVLLLDCSASMADEIESVRRNVERFVGGLRKRGGDYRLGGVLYGSMVYDTLHPTDDTEAIRRFLGAAIPIGSDEISNLAVREALRMNFREDAQRMILMITDDWPVQAGSDLGEAALTRLLWGTRARLYAVVDSCRNNSAVMTALSLGRTYNIRSPFDEVLDDIGREATTAYRLTYRSPLTKDQAEYGVTLLRGTVLNTDLQPVEVTMRLTDELDGELPEIRNDPRTGRYAVPVIEGRTYRLVIEKEGWHTLTETVDLRRIARGDTINRDLMLRREDPAVLYGRVLDEEDQLVTSAEIRLEEAATLNRVETGRTNGRGSYKIPLRQGGRYRLSASASGYIPIPLDLRIDSVAPGMNIRRDLRVTSIDRAVKSGTAFRLQNIFFDYDRAELRPESKPELERLVEFLKEYPSTAVEIGAHTDSEGSEDYNRDLSQRRAMSVLEFLVGQGIPRHRLTARGYGESTPVADNETEKGRAMNRRVEFKLVEGE